MLNLKWRWFRMKVVRGLFNITPSRYHIRLFDLIEALHILDIDHLEDVTNDLPAFYEEAS
jgi:hypothetical protein